MQLSGIPRPGKFQPASKAKVHKTDDLSTGLHDLRIRFGFLRQAPEPKAEPPNGKGAAAKGLEWCSCDMVKLYAAALRIRWEGTSAEGAILRTVNF